MTPAFFLKDAAWRSILRKAVERECVRAKWIYAQRCVSNCFSLTQITRWLVMDARGRNGTRIIRLTRILELARFCLTSRKCGWRNINFALCSANSTWKSSRAFVTDFRCDRQIINNTTSREPPVANRRWVPSRAARVFRNQYSISDY